MAQEINLDEITDVNMLQNLLDQTEDIDDRKAIRNRIQEIRSVERAKRDARLDKLTNTREDMLHERQKKAAEQKARTLAMYDHMSKSAPSGGKKVMDIGIYRTGQGETHTTILAFPFFCLFFSFLPFFTLDFQYHFWKVFHTLHFYY